MNTCRPAQQWTEDRPPSASSLSMEPPSMHRTSAPHTLAKCHAPCHEHHSIIAFLSWVPQQPPEVDATRVPAFR
jgi:hypothetical protein